MSQDISYASGDAALEQLVLYNLPSFGKHGEGLINNNFLLSFLMKKGMKEVEDGGLEFWFGVQTKKAQNGKWQGKNDDMSANAYQTRERLRWPIKVYTDSVVLNDLDKARNKGKAAIKKWLKDLIRDTEVSIKNNFNSAFWASSPGSNDPDSIPNIINTTNATGTIGGLDRSTSKVLQNGLYDTTITDIGSEAGLAIIKQLIIKYGIANGDLVDLIFLGDENYAGLCGYLATARRYRANEKMAELGFESIKEGRTTITYENTNVMDSSNSITAGYMYGINTNHMFFKLLADGNFKWDGAFERIGKQLNKATYFKVFCNLCTNLPRAHFVANDVSTT